MLLPTGLARNCPIVYHTIREKKHIPPTYLERVKCYTDRIVLALEEAVVAPAYVVYG